jgi:hypothetical protein
MDRLLGGVRLGPGASEHMLAMAYAIDPSGAGKALHASHYGSGRMSGATACASIPGLVTLWYLASIEASNYAERSGL